MKKIVCSLSMVLMNSFSHAMLSWDPALNDVELISIVISQEIEDSYGNPGNPPVVKNYYVTTVSQFISKIFNKYFSSEEEALKEFLKGNRIEFCAWWYKERGHTITSESDRIWIEFKDFCRLCSEFLEQNR